MLMFSWSQPLSISWNDGGVNCAGRERLRALLGRIVLGSVHRNTLIVARTNPPFICEDNKERLSSLCLVELKYLERPVWTIVGRHHDWLPQSLDQLSLGKP